MYKRQTQGCDSGTDQYCGKCGSNGACLICYNSFKSENVCTEVTAEVSKCEQYNNEDSCMKCKPGYYLSGDLGSMSCGANDIYNCYIINPLNNETCWFCDGYELTGEGLCDISKSCTTTECRSCESDGTTQTCTMCNPGFVLSSSGTCSSETGALLGCAQVDSDNKCVTCRYGYYVNSNQNEDVSCVKSPKYESNKINEMHLIILLIMSYLIEF